MATTVHRAQFVSAVLGRVWTYVVLAPDLPAVQLRDCPVVYLLHGACGCALDFLDQGNLQTTVERLTASQRIPPAILVMPDAFESWYVDSAMLPMQRALLDEFLPEVERNLRIAPVRSRRAIAGLSMGGYGALRLALLRPDLFHAIALMSPAIYRDLPPEGSSARQDPPFRTNGRFDAQLWRSRAWTMLVAPYLTRRMPLRFHIASGAEDEYGIADEALHLFHVLRAQTQDATITLSPGGHDWSTWAKALDPALRFLLDREQREARA